MKKYTFLMIFLLFSFTAFSNYKVYDSSIQVKEYNEVWGMEQSRDFHIYYNKADSKFAISSDDIMHNLFFSFTWENVESLKLLLLKYQEWEAKAQEMDVTLNKEIGEWKVGPVLFGMGNLDSSTTWINIKITFISKTSNDHRIVMSYPVLRDLRYSFYRNEYISLSYKPEKMYLDKDNVKKLLKIFEKSNFEKWNEEQNAQGKIEDMFN